MKKGQSGRRIAINPQLEIDWMRNLGVSGLLEFIQDMSESRLPDEIYYQETFKVVKMLRTLAKERENESIQTELD